MKLVNQLKIENVAKTPIIGMVFPHENPAPKGTPFCLAELMI